MMVVAMTQNGHLGLFAVTQVQFIMHRIFAYLIICFFLVKLKVVYMCMVHDGWVGGLLLMAFRSQKIN